ncbi:MAG: hypothetical protein IPJ74_16530 [Saprospiraceae bacterium]|nr:hypothetical protein [Saprospiraceae bacterium]
MGVDTKFIDNYGLKIIAGRAFGDDFGTEQTNVILNETAARVLDLKRQNLLLVNKLHILMATSLLWVS